MIQSHNTDANILKHYSCQYKYSGIIKWFSISVIKVSCSNYPFSITKPMSQLQNCSEYHQTCEPTHAYSMLRCVMFLSTLVTLSSLLVRVCLVSFFKPLLHFFWTGFHSNIGDSNSSDSRVSRYEQIITTNKNYNSWNHLNLIERINFIINEQKP
jgi:hypothetical protein